MRRTMLLATLVVPFVVLVAACQSATPPPPAATPVPEEASPEPAEAMLGGTAWVMTALNGAPPAAGTTVTLQFGTDGSVSGSDGCNRYMTTYQEDGQNLTFDQMAGTLMACEEPAMTQATEYREALSGVTSFNMSEGQLELLAGSDVVLTYDADVQTLADTAWLVTAYNNGREAVVGLLEGTEITLSFEATELNGNAGCNSYFAGYTAADGSMTVEPPGSTFMFCEEPEGLMEQEAAYLVALQSATTFRIEGDQLWLRNGADAIAVIAMKETIVDLPEPAPQTPTGTVTGTGVLNIRSGPGTNFPVIGAARLGDSGTIVGKSEDGRWWVVEAPTLPGGVGWVSANFVTATNADEVPVVPAPPPPAPAPTATPLPTLIPSTATPVQPTPQAQIDFSADRTQINRGECATLRWDVSNIQAIWVYPLGANHTAYPRAGQGTWRVCPTVTTTYEMRVQLTDGSTQFRQLTINVTQPAATPQPPVEPPGANPLAGTRWSVMNVNNGLGAVSALVPDTAITMEFDEAGRILGTAGCNTYSAYYQASGTTLTVNLPSSTNMYCAAPDGVMQQEQQFLTALQSAASFQITGDQLQIRSAADELAIAATQAP